MTGILKLVISLKVDIKKILKARIQAVYLYYLTTISYLHKIQC